VASLLGNPAGDFEVLTRALHRVDHTPGLLAMNTVVVARR
jgi:hypothetical protein